MRRTIAFRGAFLGGLAALAGAVAGMIAGAGLDEPAGLALIVGAFAGGWAAGYVAFRAAGATVYSVSTAASRLAEGELGQRVLVTSGATGALTPNFNHMAARVQQVVESMEAEHARLEAVFAAATDAMIAVARDTTVRFLNPAAERLLGTTQQGAIGRPLIESVHDYELDALVRRAIGPGAGAETAVITFGPRRTQLRAVAVPIREGGGWAALLMLNDLAEVQRVDAMRRDFLSNVSHELRTPLASIRALVETIEEGNVEGPEETAEFMRRILQQVDRLTTLVNELLDLSRIESGAMELRPEAVDLAALVQEATSLLRPRWEREQIAIAAPPGPGIVVDADRPSLLRVVSNLLDNAIKYSPRGGTVHVELCDEGDLAALSVRDEGPGIAPQDLPRVFERFYKGDISRATAGVGLGLAIVKHLVRAHGGTVEAASPPGSGAVFTVRLPKAFVGARRAPAADHKDTKMASRHEA